MTRGITYGSLLELRLEIKPARTNRVEIGRYIKVIAIAFLVIPVTVTRPANWHAEWMQVYLSEQADGSWRVGTSEGDGMALPTLAKANSLADVFISLLGVRADLVVVTRDGHREEYGYEEEESVEPDGVPP